MKGWIEKLRSNITSLSRRRLRLLSGILFALSAVLGYFSRRVEVGMRYMLSRVYIPDPGEYTVVYYIWELLAIAVLLFITALTLLVFSFKKKKNEKI
jgi:hypothetical protein